MPISPEIKPVNSTSYVDELGVSAGITRLPGEPSSVFFDRMLRLAANRRDSSYEGLLNQVAFELGLQVQAGIHIASQDPNLDVQCSIAGLALGSSPAIPLFWVDADGLWNWYQLSDIVAAANQCPGVSATLAGADGPALQLARQSNLLIQLNEPVSGTLQQLQHTGVLAGSEYFSFQPGPYALTNLGLLTLSQVAPSGASISYRYRLLPFDLVTSEVALISLTDPQLPAAASTSSGDLVYQVKESLASLFVKDGSYWAP